MITDSEFRALAAQGYNRIPLVLESFADLDTPLSLYLKLAQQRYTFLLESVVGGERFGRYSFIGLPAKVRIRVKGTHIEVEDAGGVIERHEGDPLLFLREFLGRFRAAPQPGLPRFCGGLAGYFGYDTVRHIEPTLGARKSGRTDALDDLPDMLLLLTDELAVIDNLAGKIYLIVYADPGEADAYTRAQERLQQLRRASRAQVAIPYQTAGAVTRAESETGPEAFQNAVRRAKDYIGAGDIMQVVLSQRMHLPFAASPLSLYRALRSLNPSPYMFYYDFGDFHVVGASPEILVRKEGSTVTLRPIAGTRPRGATREADEQLAHELASDPKEIAEHVMLLDLGRNDVGHVATTGSVRVTEQMAIERYSHVMHIVSNVEGRLAPGTTSFDVLAASFPAGTVSGAPKVRAMEIIDELEPSGRGIYAGAAGYISFQDDMDLAIAIRTGVVRDGMLYVQVGAGIVHDSVPEAEWQETLNKARAVLRAAELVQLGLDAEP
ncbi:MAG TPA: anthranilate synthase component I [Casimicrobiaceae bacterium]|nr:anthranilate synthase component I [Casimicrobiaceae bacterium]HXU66894.1 anthranilate synthase component I [Casimicrobiaceae bacterium]